VEHRPAFLTFLVQPSKRHVLRFAPWEMQTPPWTTRLEQWGTEHLRRVRLGVEVEGDWELLLLGDLVVGEEGELESWVEGGGGGGEEELLERAVVLLSFRCSLVTVTVVEES